jgi:putative ABC transport system permease protein
MRTLWQDIRYGLRMLVKNPGFAVTAVLILALAIGANTTLFSALHGLLFQSVPFSHPDRLMTVWSLSSNPQLKHFPFINVSAPDYYDWERQNTVFQDLAAMNHKWLNLTGTEEPLAVAGCAVTANYFDVFEKPPIAGRGFLPEEIGPHKANVVVLSHSLWGRAFGGRSDILGRTVTLDGQAYTVVGVAHPDMEFRQDLHVEFYVPFDLNPDQNRDQRRLWVIGRLKPDVTQAQAVAEMRTIASRLTDHYPGTNKNWTVKLIPLRELLFAEVRWSIVVLYAAAALVAVIACANMANLLVVRGLARSSEMAVRSALGAGRLRLFRQMLTESLLLSLLGGSLGLLGSWWGVDLMRGLVSGLQKAGGVTALAHITLSPWILLFTVALSFGTTLLFGLLPAWQISRARPADAMRSGSRCVGDGIGRRRLPNLLVIVEISLAFVLLTGFCLLFRSQRRLSHASLGYNPSQLLSLELTLPSTSDYEKSESRTAFSRAVLDRMQALPGVLGAASVNIHPLMFYNLTSGFTIMGRGPLAPGEQTSAEYRAVSVDYFPTLGIPLRQGRLFTRADSGSRNVVIVDEEFVRRYFPGENPIGRQMVQSGRTCEIVGIVGSVQPPRVSDKMLRAHLYEPVDQYCPQQMTFVVRATGDAAVLATALRQAVWAVNRNQPILRIEPMRDIVRDRLSTPRLITTISGLFAVAALVLTLLGLYGVMAYAVHRRTREIGVRMAFGARQADILLTMLAKGMVPVGIGLFLGLAAALILCRAMSSLLYEISPADVVTYAVVIALVTVTGLLASYVPARRAAKVDPMVALRCE